MVFIGSRGHLNKNDYILEDIAVKTWITFLLFTALFTLWLKWVIAKIILQKEVRHLHIKNDLLLLLYIAKYLPSNAAVNYCTLYLMYE